RIDAHERRNLRRRAGAIVAVAQRTVLEVQRASALPARVGRELARPRQVVRVHVVEAGLWIERLPAVLRAAVVPRKDDRRPVDGERNELAVAPHLRELLDRRGVRLWRAIGQQICGQALTRKRQRSDRQRLLRGGDLAGNRARGILGVLDREERLAVGAIEQEQVSLFRRLRDGVHP